MRAGVLALEVSILYLCVIPGSEYEGHVSLDVLIEDIKIVFTVSLHNHLALISKFVLLQGSAKLPKIRSVLSGDKLCLNSEGVVGVDKRAAGTISVVSIGLLTLLSHLILTL